MKAPIAALLLMAAPLCAQEVVFEPSATETCLAAGDDVGQCAGASGLVCMDETGFGMTTAGMVRCLDAEFRYWDARLNRAYGDLMAWSREQDGGDDSAAPSRADALQAMQRAWIPYRHAQCLYATSQWGSGTGAGPVGAECLMAETARQTLLLEGNLPQ